MRVVSISPAVHASLAHALGLSTAETTWRVSSFLRRRFGVELVLDCAAACNVGLIEAYEEFLQRYRHCQQTRAAAAAAVAVPAAVTTTSTVNARKKKRRGRRRRQGNSGGGDDLLADSDNSPFPWERPSVTKANSATDVVDAVGNAVDTDASAPRFVQQLLWVRRCGGGGGGGIVPWYSLPAESDTCLGLLM